MISVLVYLLIGVVVAILCDKNLVKQFGEFGELYLMLSRFVLIIVGPLLIIILFIQWTICHLAD